MAFKIGLKNQSFSPYTDMFMATHTAAEKKKKKKKTPMALQDLLVLDILVWVVGYHQIITEWWN